MIFEQLEKAFMVIGDRVIMASGGQKDLNDYDVIDEKTSELVVKPRPRTPKRNLETRQSLNNKTKKEICEQAAEHYGIDLDIKTEKKLLITNFLEIQNQYAEE